jgi:hypothetical protein
MSKVAISRREFGRIAAVAGAVAVPFAAKAGMNAGLAEAQSPGGDSAKPDLKPKPALTAEQMGKMDEALTKLAGQLGQLRKHTLAYGAEPAFVFRAEAPRRAMPAAPAGRKG